ncbi:hypothetical protein [Bradyrhizobium sp. USDA 4516]
MSAEDYLEMAEHYRRAKDAAEDDFTRYYLEQMEKSYRVLAASEAVLVTSEKTLGSLKSPNDPSDPQ